jgi:hypothetical protein
MQNQVRRWVVLAALVATATSIGIAYLLSEEGLPR